MVLVTVRVLPFFVLTVVLICFVTLLVSTLGVRSYSAQRYSSMQTSTTRHSSTISIGRTAGCGASSTGASGLNRDTSRSWVSGGVGPASGKGASTTVAPAAETPARRKAVWRGPGPAVAPSVASTAADAKAASGSLRSDVVTAATEAIACASSAPTGPASALAIVAPSAAPRFQIGVAGVSIPDHSKAPIAAVAHNSASANRRGLAIARLPPFGYRKARRTAGPRWDDCPLTAASCKARKLRVIIFQKGVVEMQRMYRILGNRWRIKRAVGWAKSCASDARRRRAADFAHPTQLKEAV